MKNKISLFLAILINVNIVVGGGFFISANVLSQKSGPYAALSWLVVGLFLLPLVLLLAEFSTLYPVSGGLYVYSDKTLGTFWGIISGWGYYVGTAAGNAVILHEFRKLAELLGLLQPVLKFLHISDTGTDIFFIILFAIINLFNIEILETIQALFTFLKTIPFLLVIIASFFLFKVQNLVPQPGIDITHVFKSIPIVLFAYIGIEACCAIAHIIKNGKKNTSKAILISLFTIIGLYTLIQFLIVAIHGPIVNNPFTDIIPKLTNNPFIIKWGTIIVQLSILSSFLGGSYSMFYANNWNLFSIAKEKNLPFSKSITMLNKYQSPWVCIIIQAFLVIGFLTLTKNIESLITMSDFGVVIAYLLSTVAFFIINKNNAYKIILGILSFASCGYLMYSSFNNLFEAGLIYLLPYLALLTMGIIGYKFRNNY